MYLGKTKDSSREFIKRWILNIKELFHFVLELIQKLHEVKNVCLGRKDPGNMMEKEVPGICLLTDNNHTSSICLI